MNGKLPVVSCTQRGSGAVELTLISAKRLATRTVVPVDPVKCFQRTLSGHLAATDGRIAFSPGEEAAILTVLHKKQQWPAFRGTTSTIGMRGYRSMGFHENRASRVHPC